MKKRKMFAIIIAMLLITMFISGCGSSENTSKEAKDIVKEEETEKFGAFILLHQETIEDTDITQYILYDPDTMIMWTFMSEYIAGGLSIIYNADGSPKLYEP